MATRPSPQNYPEGALNLFQNIAVKTLLVTLPRRQGANARVCSCQYEEPFADDLRKVQAMEMLKALAMGAILSATIGLVIGSQGISAGPLAVHLLPLADAKIYWSWPVFCSGSGLALGIMLLQR